MSMATQPRTKQKKNNNFSFWMSMATQPRTKQKKNHFFPRLNSCKKVLVVLPKYGAKNALSFLQRKKYTQTYVTFRPDGRKSSTISGDVLYVNQVSEQ